MITPKLKHLTLVLIFFLSITNIIVGQVADKTTILKSLSSGTSLQKYEALEKIEGSSIDEDTYIVVEKILLEEKSFAVLSKAAKTISKDKNIPVSKRVKSLSKALNKQIKYPNLTFEEGMYAPRSETYKRQYIFALEDLGPEAIPIFKEELKIASEEYRDYIYIILCNLKEPGVYPEVINILKYSKDGWLRASAARSLGKLGNKEAIPILEEALNDSFFVDKTRTGIDHFGPPSSDMNVIYPVISDAYHALRSLGVKVKPLGGHKFWIDSH